MLKGKETERKGEIRKKFSNKRRKRDGEEKREKVHRHPQKTIKPLNPLSTTTLNRCENGANGLSAQLRHFGPLI